MSGPGWDGQRYSSVEGIDGKGRAYQNASRSFVRLLWFLDFVYEMVHYLREHPDVLLVSWDHGIGHAPEGGSRGVRLGSERSTQHVGAERIPHRCGGVPIAGHLHDEDFGGSNAAASRCAVG